MSFWANNILKSNHYHTLNSLCFPAGLAAGTDDVYWFDEFLVFFFLVIWYLVLNNVYKKIVLFI